MGEHEPLPYRAGRHGSWCHCTCGWESKIWLWPSMRGPHLEFGQHLLDMHYRRQHDERP